MNQIHLIKEPGYISDLFFLFYLKYNTEQCMEHFVSQKNAEGDRAELARLLRDFAPLSDDLFVFFHATKAPRCFMTQVYFHRYKSHFKTDYNLAFVQRKLSDYAEVTRRLVEFYFDGLSSEELAACVESKPRLFELIRASDYNDTEKSRLYEFFIDPVPYIQKLQYELLAKEVMLAAYYEKNYDRILRAFNGVTADRLIEQLEPLRKVDFIKDEGAAFDLSFTLLNPFHISLVLTDDGGTVLLGVDYLIGIEEAKNRKSVLRMDDFGAALSEASRLKMLDLMLERGEITCKDLEREFNFSGSTAYHHLTILLKSGAVKSRNEGKTILYSVNSRYFELFLSELEKYARG